MFENPTIINNFGNALKKKEFTCYEFWGIPHKNFFCEIPDKPCKTHSYQKKLFCNFNYCHTKYCDTKYCDIYKSFQSSKKGYYLLYF